MTAEWLCFQVFTVMNRCSCVNQNYTLDQEGRVDKVSGLQIEIVTVKLFGIQGFFFKCRGYFLFQFLCFLFTRETFLLNECKSLFS